MDFAHANVTFNVSTNSPTEEDPRILATSYMMYKIGEGINKVYFPILVPIGVAGNILSFLVMIQPHNRRMSFSLYISALAVSDTFVLVNAFARYLNQVHEVDMFPDQRWYCSIIMNFVPTGASCSTWFIVSMTFERFYSIIQPHRAASFNTFKRAHVTIVCIVLISVLYYTPYWFIGDNSGRYCIINNYASQTIYYVLYYWLSFTGNVVLPFVLLLGMNAVVIYTLCQRSRWITSKSQDPGQSQGHKTKSSERQIYIILLLVTLGFLILTTPLHVMLFWITFASGTTPYFYASYHLFYNVGEKFRTDLLHLLRCKNSKNLPDSVDGNTMTSSISSKSNPN